uniref:G_PROTEIN_RECEP_F1_2 domain-containing protein n=1 Tax=Angiostrongylus cantonensis TaxID=6313 RepID=A0A0K0DKA1_ANGCA
MTKHWTFTGFERRTRWLALLFVLGTAIIIKNITAKVSMVERNECSGYRRFKVDILGSDSFHLGIFNTAAIFVPFFTLIFLNGGIVLMLRKQNVEQLRSLITELTMGHDVMKIRRRNLRSATNTLIVIISAYLISNLLNVYLTLTEYINADFLHVQHPDFFLLAADFASVLTVFGNAIRCPAHFLSSSEIRQQFLLLFCEDVQEKNDD